MERTCCLKGTAAYKGHITSQEAEGENHPTVIGSAMEGLILNVVINIETRVFMNGKDDECYISIISIV